MENVRIAILDAYDHVCAFMDNSAPKALHYYSDELHYFQEGSANAYTFTASAKHEDSQHLKEGNKLSFRHSGRDYYFNIVQIYKTEYEVEITGQSTVFELLNEDAEVYKASRAMTFAEYLDVFNFEKTIELGINEVSDKAISNEWTGTSTILARLFSLANVFDAEAEIITELNQDYSLKRLVLNVYRAHDDSHQGMGTYRKDTVLRYGKTIKGIKKKADIRSLYTAIYPVGTNGLTLAGISREEKDTDGNVEYASLAGETSIRAVQARDRFPSNVQGSDRYILKRWSYETENVNVLYGQALAELKKNCVPNTTYEVDGYFDTGIGDTVTIADDEFNPPLYLEARVTEQVRSFTDPKRNTTTFDNFRELKAQVDTSLLAEMNRLIKENKVYTCTITTDNGIVFKNGEGTTSLTANVRDAGADVTDTLAIEWEKDDVALATGKTVIVHARDIVKKAVYRFKALDSDIIRGTYEVTVSTVSDGADGKPGKDGTDGKDGAPGKDGVGIASVDVQYYKSTSATILSGGVWQTTSPAWENGKYIWTKTVITYTDGKTGETAAVCVTGSEGGEGADGRGVQSIVEQYYKSTSATTLSGGTWSGTYPGWENGKYIWTRSVIIYTDGGSKTTDAICVTGGKGADGTPGKDGRGVSSTVVTYQASTSGTTIPTGTWSASIPSVSAGSFLWTRTVITYTDGTTSTLYSVGKMGSNGATGPQGPAGGAGKGIKSITEYYLASASGSGVTTSTSGWTTSVQTITTSKKYLWNYEVIAYTDGTSTTASPKIIGVYGNTGATGNTGPTGATGNGIKSVTNYYLATASGSGVTSSTSGWTTSIQTITTSKKYLWNYEVIAYTNGTATTTTPAIIGVYGNTGDKGDKGDKGDTGGTGPQGPAGANGQMLYATSGTAAATAAKVATLASGSIALKAGVTVAVRFTYANTAASPTLNVNSTGAKAVYTQGVRYAYWAAGATVIFTYDGSYWRVASEPVYANTATIGNPGAGHLYIDNDSIDFYQGSVFYGSLSGNSKGECTLDSTGALHLNGKGILLGAPNHHVHIDCNNSQTSEKAFSVDATGSNAEFTANDLVLKTGSKTISLANTGTLERIAFTSATAYQQFTYNLAKYKSLVLVVSVTGGTRMLASTVIPCAIVESYKGSSYEHHAVYAEEVSNYKASCYFTSSTAGYIKSKSIYDSAALYGVL